MGRSCREPVANAFWNECATDTYDATKWRATAWRTLISFQKLTAEMRKNKIGKHHTVLADFGRGDRT